ncbi:unnamed protein product [Arctia plantaginis]|uniref:Putative inorganic phosphate cotransporter n=1 Tax=Arctia plantaginis TaxID=874455 RepID=A0A8S0YPW9_ARCPL|nr:unnamed protein product [Arctia plantaginis]CAB3260996.1 unnamed protein product [Arctia plantaginis]
MSVQDVCEVKKPSGLGNRHLQTIMWFLAMVLGYGIRNNMSMAIVVMTDPTLENSFDWNMQTQSVVLSSFFWGYIVLQIPAGELSARIGGKILIIFAMTTNAIMSILTPFSAYYGGWQLVCACRVICGLSQGFLLPSIYTLVGKWAPIEEKSRIGAVINSGSQLGTALQMLMSGFIADAWGWPAIFFVNGITGIAFVLIYSVVGADSPRKSKFISDEERLYIETSLKQIGKPKKLKTPWKAMWTSVPFISLIFVHCAQNWGYWTLMTETPSYMNQMLNVNIKANGIMSALPYLTVYILSFPFGYFADYIINKKILSVTATRKLSNSIGLYGPAIALIALSYAPPGNVTIGVLLITVVVGLNVGRLTGLMLVHLDMSPNFAGTLMGITNMSANIISIIAPLVAGLILRDETNASEWRKVFYIASAIYFIGNTQFLIFGTSVRQPWNDPSEDSETDDTAEKGQEKSDKAV